MTLLHLIRSSFLATLLGGAASSALAGAVVAVGADDYTYTITDASSIDEARTEALEKCSQRSTNCEILITRTAPGAIALAKGDDGMAAAADAVPEKARAKAMADCREKYKNCAFSALYWETGASWGAWAYAKGEQGQLAATHFSYNFASEAEASANAIEHCRKLHAAKPDRCEVMTRFGDWGYAYVESASYTVVRLNTRLDAAIADAMATCKTHSKPGDTCKLTTKAFNEGSRKQPASFDKIASLTETARAAKVPVRQASTRAVQALSCTNRCVNGSCIRTFANGRTEKWQAPRVFDPFSNDWKWDTSSCGG